MSSELIELDPQKMLEKQPLYRVKFKPNPTKAIRFSKYQPHRGKKERERRARRAE